MDLLDPAAVREIFRGDKKVGSFQLFADRVRMVHHRFLECSLKREGMIAESDVADLAQLLDDAVYLATEYTNPLVVQGIEDSAEDLPSSQVVQDALALAGTLFEYVADAVTLSQSLHPDSRREPAATATFWKDDDAVESDGIEQLGSASALYLRAGLCYGLGRHESRTQVILRRLNAQIGQPTAEIADSNCRIWADWAASALLAGRPHQIRRHSAMLGDGISRLRADLRSRFFVDSKLDATIPSPQVVAERELPLSVIEACLAAASAFCEGVDDSIEEAVKSLATATECAHQIGDYSLVWCIRTTAQLIGNMWSRSPWVKLRGVIDKRSYVSRLVDDGILVFWSSQIAALEMRSQLGELIGGYLDERIRRVIINVPTSAGKTLLAELAIAKLLLSDPGKKCVYVAPSRALCDQISSDLNERLSRFGIRVSALVTDTDISDYEGLLFTQAAVLVVTPEKLSYLIRQQSSSVYDAPLFVFDEVHNIGNPERGWTYEECITILISHERTRNSKMLLLSAVMPNHRAVQEWVDPAKVSDTVSEMWQPTRLLKGAITFQPIRPQPGQLEVNLPADLTYIRFRSDIASPLRIPNILRSRQVGKPKPTNSYWERDAAQSDGHVEHAAKAAEKFAQLGPVLVYNPTKSDAARFCSLLSNSTFSPDLPDSEQSLFSDFIGFMEDRLPENHPLIGALQRGIAFHHGGLPRDVRNELEHAFRQGWIRILAATTTLAEGVNLPVRTLLLADYCFRRTWDPRKREWAKVYSISKGDFRNIAGRAGRALYETEGQVVFIQPTAGYPFGPLQDDFMDFLNTESDSPELAVRSALADEAVLRELAILSGEIDSGKVSDEEFLFAPQASLQGVRTKAIVQNLHSFALLVRDQKLTGESEADYVTLLNRTFLGTTMRDQATPILGSVLFRSANSQSRILDDDHRHLFAQTGLKITTCRQLLKRTNSYWEYIISDSPSFFGGEVGSDELSRIAAVVYDLEDPDTDPQTVLLAREGTGSRTRKRLADDCAMFADWILLEDRDEVLQRHFSFIRDPMWRAEQFVDYTQQTLGYRTPWLLSAFWIFSKWIVASRGIDLASTPLGRTLLLLPAFSKFGVSSPAAALFSTVGISPAKLARELGKVYDTECADGRYDYPRMLRWLLRAEPSDLARRTGLTEGYLRRFTRTVAGLRPPEDVPHTTDSTWLIEFYVAGWSYHEGDRAFPTLRVGHELLLRHDPHNPHDTNAVEIYDLEGNLLGFVPRGWAQEVASRIGVRPLLARVARINPLGQSFEKVQVRIEDRW